MTEVRFLVAKEYATQGGTVVVKAEAGTRTSLHPDQAAAFLEQGIVEVVDLVDVAPEPDVFVPLVDDDSSEDAEDAEDADAKGGGEGQAPGEPLPRPAVDAVRTELDAYAATLGLNTTKATSKAKVNEAIDAKLAELADQE